MEYLVKFIFHFITLYEIERPPLITLLCNDEKSFYLKTDFRTISKKYTQRLNTAKVLRVIYQFNWIRLENSFFFCFLFILTINYIDWPKKKNIFLSSLTSEYNMFYIMTFKNCVVSTKKNFIFWREFTKSKLYFVTLLISDDRIWYKQC